MAECAARWRLTLGAPLDGGVAYVVGATRADGGPAVLKLNFPDAESEHEAAALRHWHGRGAVEVLADDPERRALLLARCTPGSRLPPDAVAAVVPELLQALWGAPAPRPGAFPTVAELAPGWHATIAGLGVDPPLVARALRWLEELAAGAPEALLVNQDLHAANVLRDGGGWKLIDPKPIVGERAFDLVALGRNRPDPRWLAGIARAAGADPERARRWAVVHALAWARESERVLAAHVAAARALSA